MGNGKESNLGRAGAHVVRRIAHFTPPEIKRAVSQIMTDAMLRSPDPLKRELVGVAQDPENLLNHNIGELRKVRDKLPETVVIIPDGNRRYAKQHRMTESQGHDMGARMLYEGLRVFDEFREIKNVVLWVWSEDNEAGRPDEKKSVFGTVAKYLEAYTPDLKNRNVKIRSVGRDDRFGDSEEAENLREQLKLSQYETSGNDGTNVILAIDYGEGFEDSLFAHGLVGEVDLSTLTPEKATEIRRYTMAIPEPDLVIRTSGEMRLSKFPYGSHAEIVPVATKLPAILPHEMAGALLEYTRRDIRKGK
jgi:undecaprenyl diphosphate synthase